MVEQKTTKEILSTAIKDFDVFPSQKGVLIYVDQELDNQVWLRKDEQVERVKKSVFIEHLTEKQQKELWEALYG